MADQDYKLAAYVHVAGQDFMPGDVPPPDIAKQIRNPKCWEGGQLPYDNGFDFRETVLTPEQLRVIVDGPPPRSGPGSSTEAWAVYAKAQGVDVPDDASRDDIIAVCERAGVID